MIRLMLAGVLGLGLVLTARAEDKKEEKKEEATWIKVEAKGTLQTGIVAIGGETTGTVLKTKDASVELDFSKSKMKPMAFDKKTVVVTGVLTFKKRVTGTGVRMIVLVTSIKEAKEEKKETKEKTDS